MIVKATFRGAGGLGRHLSNVQKNEEVIVCEDLCSGCIPVIIDAVAMIAAMGKATGIERSIVHIVVSPGAKLPAGGESTIVETVRREYGIDTKHPFLVVAHVKNSAAGREAHYHLVLPRKNPYTGKSISDRWNFRTNEKIARLLEREFGHQIVSGRFNRSIAQELMTSQPALAAELLEIEEPAKHLVIGQETTQQSDRLMVDQKSFDDSVWNAWNSCAGDFSAFAVKLDALGMSVARGNRAMLVLDDATGYSAPLVRLLRRRAKAVGSKVSLREADFTAAFSAARDFVMARDEGLNRARAVAETSIDRECAKGIMEAVANADQDSAADFHKERAKRRTQDEASASGTAHLEETLKVRRDAIWAAYRERDRLRRKRVDRAFRAARIARSGAYEEVAFLLAAGAALLTGMALSVALGFVALTTAAAKIARGAARLHESPSAAIAATTAQTAADLESTQAKGRKASKNRLRRSGNTVRRGSGIGE